MKIVFTADTHLHPCAWASMPGVSGDAYRSFDQIVEYCLSTPNVGGLILGGDVFDAQPPAEAVYRFLRGIQRLRDKLVFVGAVQGQHGRDTKFPWPSVGGWVQDLHKTYWSDESQVSLVRADTSDPPMQGAAVIYGLDNMGPDELKTELENLGPATTVLVLHQMCKGSLPVIEGHQNWDLDPDWVPEHVRSGQPQSRGAGHLHSVGPRRTGSTKPRHHAWIDTFKTLNYYGIAPAHDRPVEGLVAVALETRSASTRPVLIASLASGPMRVHTALNIQTVVRCTAGSVASQPLLDSLEPRPHEFRDLAKDFARRALCSNAALFCGDPIACATTSAVDTGSN